MDFGSPTKLQYAKQLAAALGFIGLIRADRIKVEALGGARQEAGPVLRGRRSLWRLLEYLDGIQPGLNVPLAESIKSFCLRSTGKGILVLLTDLLDKSGYETALRVLLAQKMDVYVVHILSPRRAEPGIAG